jgi:hypothetical protein
VQAWWTKKRRYPLHDQLVLTQVPVKDLIQLIKSAVREELLAKDEAKEEQLISPDKVCSIFQPKITRPTLQSYTDQGLIKSYRLGGRVWYKYSEIMNAIREIKRYKKTGDRSPAA